MPSFGEYVDFRRRTRLKLESRWSRGVYGCQSKNKLAYCHGRDRDIRCAICETRSRRATILQQTTTERGTSRELNQGDVLPDLPEPMLIIPQLL